MGKMGLSLCFFLFISIVFTAEGQSVQKLCRQVYTDCQACSVFQTECAGRPQKPERPHVVPKPTQAPTTTKKPQPQCLADGKGCSTSTECCNGNCKVVTIPMNGNFYTIKVCRSPNVD